MQGCNGKGWMRLRAFLIAAILMLALCSLAIGETGTQSKEQLGPSESLSTKDSKVTGLPEKVMEDPATGMEFIFVKGGCFRMGDTFGDGFPDEKPVHEVCVDDFWVGKYEVTQAQWQKVMENNPSDFKKGGSYPVETVNWADIQAFTEKLSATSKKQYRLPTEAEWEYAARSGGKPEKWAGTSEQKALGEYAWYDANSEKQTHPVGQKKPNGLGLYDMSGNVLEWCTDWYEKTYYTRSPKENPKGPENDKYRVLRGGAWLFGAVDARVSNRIRFNPSHRSYGIGFRLVLSPGS
jgi:formylglycine-generating enzyme